MIIRSNRDDIVKLISLVLSDTKYQPVVSTIRDNVSMDGDIGFKKKLKIGDVQIRVQIYPLENGDLELNITKASIAGLGIFGVVRKKAGEMTVSVLTQYLPQCKTWKNEKGNIQMHIPGVTFKQFGIVGEEILVELLV